MSYASSFGKRLDHSKSRCHRLFRLPLWQRQDDVVNLRDRLAVTARDLAVAENRLLVIADEADILRGQLESTETRLGLKQQLSERETPQPSELAAKVRPVEPVLFEPAPYEANLAHPRVSMPNIFADAKRRAEGIDEPARPRFGRGQYREPVFAIRREPRRRRSLRPITKSGSARRRHRRRQARPIRGWA